MSELSNLTPAPGAVRKKKRIGRGESSGWGKTAGKGHKGQLARAGKGKPRLGFEGGQMPLARRLPKRGFIPRNRIEFAVINVGQLGGFEAGDVIDLDALRARGLVKKGRDQLKVLAHGDIDRALTIRANKFSKAAMDKITAAGGQVELIES
ncbi:MAG: 50S ribosomal protein L15 [Myxococcales bacterium]|nr:50S ribosomal protein L15 [Myxococcales bacterium]